MRIAFSLLVIGFMSGCTSNNVKPDIHQSEVALTSYTECVKQESLRLSDSKSRPQDIALASLGSCQPQYSAFELALEQFYMSGVSNSAKPTEFERAKVKAQSIKSDVGDLAVSLVVNKRAEASK